MPSRGRPLKTEVRERIASILARVGQSYGYELYKYYSKVFGKMTMRNLYYNLRKGLKIGEFIIADVRQEIGAFTWGGATQHIYYTLGPYSHLYATTDRQKELIGLLPQKEVKIDWEKEANNQIHELEESVRVYHNHEARMPYEDKTKFRSTLKNRADLLKEWMANRFERDVVHAFRVKIDEIVKKAE
jgi:hypothetical protein